MKFFKEIKEAHDDAYTRDYKSSIAGMNKKDSYAYQMDGGANDEGWDREEYKAPSQTWYIRINGKLLKKDGQPFTFRDKAGANKAALTMMAKPFNSGKKFTLTTSPTDAVPAQESIKESAEDLPMYGAIIHRIMVAHPDLLQKYGPEKIMQAADDEAEWVGDVEEIGSSDVSISVKRVMQALQEQHGVTEAEENPEDVICVDVPLFIRLMEYAREDAKTDMDLHDVTERITKLCADGNTLGMDSYDAIVGAQEQVAEDENMPTGNLGYDNMSAIMRAVDAGQDATIQLGGEPVTLEYPEARFIGGKYKAFVKAGRQEEFLKYMSNPVAFDRLMSQLRGMLDKIKNFKGSVPGERGVEEAYSMDDVRKDAAARIKQDMDTASDNRIAQAKDKKEEPFMAKVGRKIVGGVKGAWKGFTESAPPNFPMDLEKKLLAQYKDEPEKAYATMWTIHNKKKNESVQPLPQVEEGYYWCQIDKTAKLIPEGYKKLANGFLTRK